MSQTKHMQGEWDACLFVKFDIYKLRLSKNENKWSSDKQKYQKTLSHFQVNINLCKDDRYKSDLILNFCLTQGLCLCLGKST